MINFFRKKRKSLANENRSLKYFRYAIGEIVLVVIGILIALSINNWNDNRKARIFEHKMLNEVRKNLISDAIYFNGLKTRVKKVKVSADRFIRMKINNNIVIDSVDYLFKELGTFSVFSYNKGAYESLKSIGLDKISNDFIRNKIAEMYDFILPRTKELINIPQNETAAYYNKTFDMFFVVDYNVSSKSEPTHSLTIEPPLLFNQPRFLNTVYHSKRYAVNFNFRLERITKQISSLLKSIDSELNRAW